MQSSLCPRPLALFGFLFLLTTGCAPTAMAAPTETASPRPSDTAQPSPPATQTRVPTSTASLIPYPTATSIPQPINAETAGRLTVSERFTLEPSGSVERLLWTPDSAWILSQTTNGLDVIDPNSLQITTSYDGFVGRHFIQDGRLFGVRDGLPVVLNLDSGKVEPVDVQVPAEGDGRVGFDLSQDGKSIAIPADGPAFDVISLATGEVTRYEFTMDNRDPFSVKRVSFSYDGTVAVVNVWRRNDYAAEAIVGVGLKWGNKLYELSAGGEPMYSADGKRMMLYNLSGNLGTYVVANGQPWGDLSTWFSTDTGDGGEVSYSRFYAQFWGGMEPPGYKIGVLYQGDYRNEEAGVWRWADSQLLIYDTRNDEMIQSLLHLPPLILGFSFSPDGEAFVLATQDGDLSLWETASAVSLRTATPYDVNTEPQISPDGRRVAYSYHSSARVFSPSGELQQVITPTHGTLDLEVRFVDANRLAMFYLSISGDYVEIWDLVRGEIAYIAPYVLGPCDFTADGHTMICHQPSTRFMDTRTGEKLMDVGEAAYGIGRYAFSPDDRYIAYCGIDWPSISLFKRSTGKYLGRFTADALTVCGNLAFSPDSGRLASAAGFVWNVSSLRPAFAFAAHPESAPWTPLAYGPQGDIFFVGGDVFDAATGNKLANIPVGGQALYFSADGTRLIAVSNREWSIWTTR